MVYESKHTIPYSMKKVLITGGAGYLGSILTELLLHKEYEVTVIDNLLYRQTSPLHLFKYKNYKFIHGDINDKQLLLREVSKNDIIIPLAAIVGAPACDAYPALATDTNYLQIQHIVDNLSKDQKLIVPNTNSQYGSSKKIVTEESPALPLSHYAVTKCDAEKALLDKQNGIALRLATVFGVSPRMRLDLLVNDFVYKAFTDNYLVLFESKFKRNFIHVCDVASAFFFMIHNYEKCNNQAYNVGLSDANITKMELALKIKEHIPNLVIHVDEFFSDKDKRDYVVSNAKIESLGWVPLYSLDDGIKELLTAYPIIKHQLCFQYTNV